MGKEEMRHLGKGTACMPREEDAGAVRIKVNSASCCRREEEGTSAGLSLGSHNERSGTDGVPAASLAPQETGPIG